jgi:hypothetical protein
MRLIPRLRIGAAFVAAAALTFFLLDWTLPGSGTASAQRGKVLAPGQLVIAGRRLTCGETSTLIRDFDGLASSSSVIVLNLPRLNDLPKRVRWLIYYHECGHIRLGPSETAADCYAVQRAKREGWLNESGLDDICTTFSISGHGPVHLDPTERCEHLRQCFRKAPRGRMLGDIGGSP